MGRRIPLLVSDDQALAAAATITIRPSLNLPNKPDSSGTELASFHEALVQTLQQKLKYRFKK
jgi:hypothetical protein